MTEGYIPINEIGWEIWLCDHRGWRMQLLDYVTDFSIVKTANNIGAFSLTIPFRESENTGLLPGTGIDTDNIVEFWRSPEGGRPIQVFTGFIRKWAYEIQRDNTILVHVSGRDAIDLLDRRIVAYYAEDTESAKTDYADDMLKEMVSENIGSGADDYSGSGTARDLSSYNFTVAADVSKAPSISKAFAWRNLLTACQDIALASETGGTDLYFDIVPVVQDDQRLGFEFRTYTDQIGIDRSLSGYHPLFFGTEYGNIANAVLTYDYSEEINYVYAGGQGEQSDRVIEVRSDTARIGKSVWNRCEGFADARNCTTAAAIQAVGDDLLSDGQPKVTFQADLLDTKDTRFGTDWFFGDKVECSFMNMSVQGMIKTIQISVNSKGDERIIARIKADL